MNTMMDILCCPQCLRELSLQENSIVCAKCEKSYPIVNGVPIFGVSKKVSAEREREIHGETDWVTEVVSMDAHVEYAQRSALFGQQLIDEMRHIRRGPLKILDLGAGMGLQSWQLLQNDFVPTAFEICPEFALAAKQFPPLSTLNFVVGDCTILPFKKNSFDAVFLKEIVHHIENLSDFASEISRVLRNDALIMMSEPCRSGIMNKFAKDVAKEHGMSHHYHSRSAYLKMIKQFSTIISEKDTPIPQLNRGPNIFKRFFVSQVGGSIKLIAIHDRKYFLSFERTIRQPELTSGQEEKAAWISKNFLPRVFSAFEQNTRIRFPQAVSLTSGFF